MTGQIDASGGVAVSAKFAMLLTWHHHRGFWQNMLSMNKLSLPQVAQSLVRSYNRGYAELFGEADAKPLQNGAWIVVADENKFRIELEITETDWGSDFELKLIPNVEKQSAQLAPAA